MTGTRHKTTKNGQSGDRYKTQNDDEQKHRKNKISFSSIGYGGPPKKIKRKRGP
jgi:hypothetical protein